MNAQLMPKEGTVNPVIQSYWRFLFLPKNLALFKDQQARVRYFQARFSHLDIEELTPELLKESLPAHLSGSSQVKYFECWRALLDYGVACGLLPANPLQGVAKPKAGPGRQKYLSQDQLYQLLDGADATDNLLFYGIIYFAVVSGRRKGELLRLRRSDLDPENNTLTFRNRAGAPIQTLKLTSEGVHILMGLPRLGGANGLIFSLNGVKPYVGFKRNFVILCARLGFKDFTFQDLSFTYKQRVSKEMKL